MKMQAIGTNYTQRNCNPRNRNQRVFEQGFGMTKYESINALKMAKNGIKHWKYKHNHFVSLSDLLKEYSVLSNEHPGEHYKNLFDALNEVILRNRITAEEKDLLVPGLNEVEIFMSFDKKDDRVKYLSKIFQNKDQMKIITEKDVLAGVKKFNKLQLQQGILSKKINKSREEKNLIENGILETIVLELGGRYR